MSSARGFRLAALALVLIGTAACAEQLDGRAVAIAGDTVEIDGRAIRLAGIAAPRAGQVCALRGRASFDCAERSRHELAGLLSSMPVRCEVRRDKHAEPPLWGRCRLDPVGTDLASWMILRGWAVATTEEFRPFERVAAHMRIGMWTAVALTEPDLREQGWGR
ncbi:MAG: thermonuclease family protein [Alphaproteobacteria bacterium]